ncbi:MAG TPA: ABC transporter permease [Terriglobales bacterium]|nr:ABC transporter permease [Terriglobales bacterium]
MQWQSWLKDAVLDARLGLRRLARWRGMAALALITLAVALGATTAMYSAFDELLLHPLPYPQAQQLYWLATVRLAPEAPSAGGAPGVSVPDFLDYRSQSHTVRYWGGYYANVATIVGQGPSQHVSYANVSGDFFPALAIAPELGRWLNRDDERPALPQVAVLSHGLWQSRFGGDPHIVGKPIVLDNRALTIVGVMPAGFAYPLGTELWAPEPFTNQSRGLRFLDAFVRLAPGVTAAGAREELSAIASRLAAEYPVTNTGQGVAMESLAAHQSGPYQATLWLMMLAMIVVLGIAAANVANLLIAGAVERWREMALRTALGAGRGRLLRQLAVEAAVLSGLSGGLGYGLAALVLLPWLRQFHPPALPQLAHLHLSWTGLGFASLLTLGTAAWFSLAPGWELLRVWGGRRLLSTGWNQGGSTRSRISSSVVVIEMAACIVLLVAAGLLAQSLERLQKIDPGFDAAHLLSFRASLLFNTPAEFAAKVGFFQRLNDRLQTLPGVKAAGLSSEIPLEGIAAATVNFYVPGTSGAALPDVERHRADFHRVLPGYFHALGTPVEGRTFTDADGPTAERVVIISRSLARSFFPGDLALGHSLSWGRGAVKTVRIVGIAGDIHQLSLSQPPGFDFYVPELQSPAAEMSVVVRAAGDSLALLPDVRRVMEELDPQVPIYDVASMQQRVDAAQAPDRFRSRLLAAMAVLALLLAAAGIYGVLAQRVALRRQEIGIRMAIGAEPAQVSRQMMADSLRLALIGMAIGLALAYLLSRLWSTWLYDAQAGSLATWLTVPLILAAVAIVASVIPARQAAAVDPAVVLKQ